MYHNFGKDLFLSVVEDTMNAFVANTLGQKQGKAKRRVTLREET